VRHQVADVHCETLPLSWFDSCSALMAATEFRSQLEVYVDMERVSRPGANNSYFLSWHFCAILTARAAVS
jgi:hypothetical protein